MNSYLNLTLALVLSYCLSAMAVDAPRRRTYYDLYNDFVSLPQPKALFGDVVCKDGDTSKYHLVDVSNSTPAEATIDCGAYTAGRGQMIHVVPHDGKKAAFFVELIKVDEVWMGTVYSDDTQKVKKRYQWDDNGLQGSLLDLRSDVTFTGNYKDNKLIGTARLRTSAGDVAWENDGYGHITHFALTNKGRDTPMASGDCRNNLCPVYDENGEKLYTFKAFCSDRIDHRCFFDIIEEGLNLD